MTQDEIVEKVDNITEVLSNTVLAQFGLTNDTGYADLTKEQVNIILLSLAHTVLPYLRAIGHKDADGFLAYLKLESDERIQEALWQTVVAATRPDVPKLKLN